ncbi:MAG: hypothetical protein JRH03_16865, partial [Deltaproteobacteria bacterium]|nr:hypothetical protein [Deltaproteobacteria bacterium]
MNSFIMSIALICCGGIAALAVWRQFVFMKIVAVSAISVGCTIGLIDALTKLLHPGTYT